MCHLNKSLVSIDFCDCMIGDEGMRTIFIGMNELKNWSRLDLSDNYITSKGMIYICDALKQ
jgi:Ran GTPase-activating protein (RanGAP) involved in mRNA processing and transport